MEAVAGMGWADFRKDFLSVILGTVFVGLMTAYHLVS
jgi:hypothetical protein